MSSNGHKMSAQGTGPGFHAWIRLRRQLRLIGAKVLMVSDSRARSRLAYTVAGLTPDRHRHVLLAFR